MGPCSALLRGSVSPAMACRVYFPCPAGNPTQLSCMQVPADAANHPGEQRPGSIGVAGSLEAAAGTTQGGNQQVSLAELSLHRLLPVWAAS